MKNKRRPSDQKAAKENHISRSKSGEDEVGIKRENRPAMSSMIALGCRKAVDMK